MGGLCQVFKISSGVSSGGKEKHFFLSMLVWYGSLATIYTSCCGTYNLVARANFLLKYGETCRSIFVAEQTSVSSPNCRHHKSHWVIGTSLIFPSSSSSSLSIDFVWLLLPVSVSHSVFLVRISLFPFGLVLRFSYLLKCWRSLLVLFQSPGF